MTRVRTRLCANSIYPCYYFYCSADSVNKPAESLGLRTFRCAKGLVFSEKLQRCVYTLPWKSCEAMKDKTSVDVIARMRNVTKIASSSSAPFKQEVKSEPRVVKSLASLVYDPNYIFKHKESTDEESKSEDDSIGLSSANSLRIEYLDSLYTSKEREDEENKPGFSFQVSYNFSLENSSIAGADDQYAYIIVPIKLSSIQKLKSMNWIKSSRLESGSKKSSVKKYKQKTTTSTTTHQTTSKMAPNDTRSYEGSLIHYLCLKIY